MHFLVVIYFLGDLEVKWWNVERLSVPRDIMQLEQILSISGHMVIWAKG